MQNLKNQTNFLEAIHNKEPYKDAGIDVAHAMVLFGVILAQKPKNILELGIGTGVASETILNAIKYNSMKCQYDAVDFCMQFSETTKRYEYQGHWAYPTHEYIEKLRKENVNLIGLDERVFVENCESNKYDLIISDADHERAGEWADHIFRICKPNGIIFMHDIAGTWHPSLQKYMEYINNHSIPHYLFEKNSRGDEICQRGWLMIINKK
jgi:predicted O-methyltransferase YrrM